MKRRGLVIVLVAAALLMIAATIRSGWLYLVSSFLVSLVVLGLVSGWSSTRGLLLARESRGDAFEGETIPVRLRVTNGGRLTRYFLTFTDLTFLSPGVPPRSPAGGAGGEAARSASRAPTASVERIAPGGSVDLEYRVEAPGRGVYETARVSVSSGGLFGTARFTRTAGLDGRLVVYPRVHPVAGFPFERRPAAAPPESRDRARKGAGQEYYGIREYLRGDALRDIHWRSTARLGELIVKEYRQEFQPSAGVVLLLYEPVEGGALENSLEDGLRCAASVLDCYEAIGARPRLALPAVEGVEWVRAADPFDNLEALAAYSPPPRPQASGGERRRDGEAADLARAFKAAAGGLEGGGALALVTNTGSESAAAFLREAEGVEGASLVLVMDRSYAPGWGTGDTLLEISKLEASGGRGVALFVMTRGREIGECLSAPLSVTAR